MMGLIIKQFLMHKGSNREKVKEITSLIKRKQEKGIIIIIDEKI